MRTNSAQWDCGHSGLGGLNGQKAHRLSPLVGPVDSKRLAGGPIKKSQDEGGCAPYTFIVVAEALNSTIHQPLQAELH